MRDLITLDEIATMLRAKRRTVAERWIKLSDFPKPAVAVTRHHRLWEREAVMRWAQRGVRA